jgi:hypothetical protein
MAVAPASSFMKHANSFFMGSLQQISTIGNEVTMPVEFLKFREYDC